MSYLKGDLAWLKKYEELKQYKVCEGHCNVPSNFGDNKRLAKWVSNQRTQYKLMKQGKPSNITKQRVHDLENIGFQWSINGSYDDAWYKKYEELKQYKGYEGHCNVPKGFSDNKRLGAWVNYQRTQYKHMRLGKPSSMTEQRIRHLEDVGFQWSMKAPYDDAWYKKYEELKHYKGYEGHCNVHKSCSYNKCLAMWVSTQRTQYKHMKLGKPSSMTEQRIRHLEDVGFQWSIMDPYDDAWYKKYEELKQYKNCKGHCNVSKSFGNNISLAKWVGNQRTQYKHRKQCKPSSMTEQRIQYLENIGFQWSIKDPSNNLQQNNK